MMSAGLCGREPVRPRTLTCCAMSSAYYGAPTVVGQCTSRAKLKPTPSAYVMVCSRAAVSNFRLWTASCCSHYLKGYGGAEEELQPYAPLQAAAIKYLQRNDVSGLRAWISRHLPLAVGLMDDGFRSYLEFSAVMGEQLASAIERYLSDYGRFEVVGASPRKDWRDVFRKIYLRLRGVTRSTSSREREQAQLTSYYVSRFFAPRANTLALQLEQLPLEGRLLSLCCGQGVFENLLRSLGGQCTVVSVDAQFLNLLCARRFVHPNGVYLCHDLQFPLPFVDGAFDGVFSSTCLPEIPAQRTFASEAIRATADAGWTFFDSIWNLDMPDVRRIVENRHYRFCQNFFTDLGDYLDFFAECAGPSRSLALDVPDVPARYLGAPRWITERGAMLEAIRAKTDDEISVLVTKPDHFRKFRGAHHDWLSAETLSISPAFDVAPVDGALRLRRKPAFDKLASNFAPGSFAGYPEALTLERARLGEADYRYNQFGASVFVSLPGRFDRDTQSLGSLLATLRHP
jgi:Methyltransferase domain